MLSMLELRVGGVGRHSYTALLQKRKCSNHACFKEHRPTTITINPRGETIVMFLERRYLYMGIFRH